MMVLSKPPEETKDGRIGVTTQRVWQGDPAASGLVACAMLLDE